MIYDTTSRHYFLPGPIGAPVVLALHGWLQSAGGGWGWFNFPEWSGLIELTKRKQCTLVCPSAGFARNWSEADGRRVADLALAYSSWFQTPEIIGLGFSDGVRGLLAADNASHWLFSALICVSGVCNPSQEISPVGCPAWFCCGEKDIRSVGNSLAEFSYRFRGRGSRIGRFPGRHRWPTQLNEQFYEWATTGYTID